MYAGISIEELAESKWKIAKPQTIKFGSLNVSMDFSDGLTKEQFLERERREFTNTRVLKNGKMIMPSVNIY